MVKKIKLDFSKVEERSGWNTKEMPEGIHEMKIVDVSDQDASDGTDMLTYALVPTDEKYKARRFPFYCKLQPNQYWKLRDLLVAAGQTVPKKAVNIDPNSVIGKVIAAEVEDETGQYAGRSSISAVYSTSILDDDAAPADDEDEEYEGDEEDTEEEGEEEDVDLDSMTLPELRALAKEYGIKTPGKKQAALIEELTEAMSEDAEDEDDEEDEDEEAEDLSALTLPELRKRAKELGITTTGLKQAALIEAIEEAEAEGDEDEDDDEEELEDEDLGDDELYDDEEEEDEAPAKPAKSVKRPATRKAPAKPAAKAAAPARRVVRR